MGSNEEKMIVVKLTRPTFYGSIMHPAGTRLTVGERIAERMFRSESAVYADGRPTPDAFELDYEHKRSSGLLTKADEDARQSRRVEAVLTSVGGS